MATPLQGEPERAPAPTGAGALRTFAESFFPHSADHGERLFTHPSTNRGGTPGRLNGEPVYHPNANPVRRISLSPGANPGGPMLPYPQRSSGTGPRAE